VKSRSSLPAFRGVWAWIDEILAGRGLVILASLCLVTGAIVGLQLPIGEHPGEGLWIRLPLAVVPLVIISSALGSDLIRRVASVFLAVGIWCILLGGWSSEGTTGRLTVGSQKVEGFERTTIGRKVMIHMGTQVDGQVDDAQVKLSIGMTDSQVSKLVFSRHAKVEQTFGEHSLYLDRVRRQNDAQVAVLRVSDRATGKRTHVVTVPVGRPVVIPDGPRLTVEQIRNDFLSRLGASVQVDIQWDGGQDNAWHFSDAPDIDTRIGDGPWRIELLGLKGSETAQFGVRSLSNEFLVWVGWPLMLFGILLGFKRSESEAAA
jgi:hypothetical protein